MNEVITENNYPIELKWVYKTSFVFFIAIAITIVLFIFGYYDFYSLLLIICTPIYLVIRFLRRKNFHYAIEDKFMILRQGILSKQERHIPYGVIQNIFVKQDLFDRIFGLASVTVENAAQGGGSIQGKKFLGMTIGTAKKESAETVGFSGNKVSIPGLTRQNAEALKTIILAKMKANPVEDSQSGL